MAKQIPHKVAVKKSLSLRARVENFLFPETSRLMGHPLDDGPFVGIAFLFQMLLLPWVFAADMLRLGVFFALAGGAAAACYYGAHFMHWV